MIVNSGTKFLCDCGSADWIVGAPGTAADATAHAWAENVKVLRPEAEIPTKVWCRACLRQSGRLKSVETACA